MEEVSRSADDVSTAFPWAGSTSEVCSALGVEPLMGLLPAEVRERRERYGPNRLEESRPVSWWRLLAAQFQNLIVGLLAVAAILAMALGDHAEAIAVLVVLLINSALGFVIEWRATRSMEALKKLVVLHVRVRRRKTLHQVTAHELVPGDIVVVEAGDVVSADLRLIEAAEIQADESALTGESAPISKSTRALLPDTGLADRINMLHSGSRITRGTGTGVVVATGLSSELGKISSMVVEAEAREAAESTPLERRLAHLGVRLVWLTLAIAVVTLVAGIVSGKELGVMVKTAIALAVAAIPEGLPVVATIALARGLWRMAERDALINRLAAVETLGATGIICTDKTGTLTENRMTLVRALLPDGTEIDRFHGDTPSLTGPFRELLRIGVLCNHAAPPKSGDGEGIGDPLEVALLSAAMELVPTALEWREEAPRIREVPFDSERRLMATFHQAGGEEIEVAVKGGPEAVLAACRLKVEERERWNRENLRFADEGLRVLAVALKRVSEANEPPFENLEFAGLLGLIDPPRGDVPGAIRACREAGIRVVMVTGDQPRTGLAVAREVGLIAKGECRVVHGDDFDRAKPADLLDCPIFARVTPAQKLQLVELHQKNGQVVAMTGDGVNDAPALTQADIGIAMGRRGTEVAREASDMVLRDDAFPSIVFAVAQGRVIFSNIRKFVTYLLSCNLSEILVVGAATLFTESLPIIPLQILFLNLVTDIFPALALGVGNAGANLMAEPPRPSGEPVIRKSDWRQIVTDGVVLSLATLGSYLWAVNGLGHSPEGAITVSFLTLATAQLVQVFNLAEKPSPFFRSEVVKNPLVWAALLLCAFLLWAASHLEPLAGVLGLHAPNRGEWLAIAGFGLVPLFWELIQRSVRLLKAA